MIKNLNERTQTVLRMAIDSYMETGDPVGARTLSKGYGLDLSPATIRNVMADLESDGYLYSPHTSAGRLPTQRGLRLYIDGLMQIGDLSADERREIETRCRATGEPISALMEKASEMLSGLSAAAGLVIAPKADKPVKKIEFIQIDPGKILVILVMQDNMVENRVMDVGGILSPSALAMAANYLNDRLGGKSLSEARSAILAEIDDNRAALDALTASLVRQGLAVSAERPPGSHLFIRGQSKLLQDIRAIEDLEKARQLLAALEEQETAARFLGFAQEAEGVQIFIGAENRMFDHAGWSVVISPYRDPGNTVIGAIGVIGPVRLNYGRIVPVIDYTAQVMERIMAK